MVTIFPRESVRVAFTSLNDSANEKDRERLIVLLNDGKYISLEILF